MWEDNLNIPKEIKNKKKDEITNLDLNDYVRVNEFIRNNSQYLTQKDSEYIIYDLYNIFSLSDINKPMHQFISTNSEKIKEIYDNGFEIYCLIYNDRFDNNSYMGLLKQEDNKYYLLDEVGTKIYLSNSDDLIIRDYVIKKILPKNKYSMKLKDLVNQIQNNEYMKYYKYSIQVQTNIDINTIRIQLSVNSLGNIEFYNSNTINNMYEELLDCNIISFSTIL